MGPRLIAAICLQTRPQESDLRAARDLARAVNDTVRESLLVLDGKLCIQFVNRAFSGSFDIPEHEAKGRTIDELADGQWKNLQLRKLLEAILPTDQPFENFRIEHEFPHVGRKVLLLNARKIESDRGRAPLILLAIDDVTPPG